MLPAAAAWKSQPASGMHSVALKPLLNIAARRKVCGEWGLPLSAVLHVGESHFRTERRPEAHSGATGHRKIEARVLGPGTWDSDPGPGTRYLGPGSRVPGPGSRDPGPGTWGPGPGSRDPGFSMY
jgi:hypothetical protein